MLEVIGMEGKVGKIKQLTQEIMTKKGVNRLKHPLSHPDVAR
jgi:metal-responsive CopG/Arc/MetJ family transcriptional regulator